jgi:hypothetical protein
VDPIVPTLGSLGLGLAAALTAVWSGDVMMWLAAAGLAVAGGVLAAWDQMRPVPA